MSSNFDISYPSFFRVFSSCSLLSRCLGKLIEAHLRYLAEKEVGASLRVRTKSKWEKGRVIETQFCLFSLSFWPGWNVELFMCRSNVNEQKLLFLLICITRGSSCVKFSYFHRHSNHRSIHLFVRPSIHLSIYSLIRCLLPSFLPSFIISDFA